MATKEGWDEYPYPHLHNHHPCCWTCFAESGDLKAKLAAAAAAVDPASSSDDDDDADADADTPGAPTGLAPLPLPPPLPAVAGAAAGAGGVASPAPAPATTGTDASDGGPRSMPQVFFQDARALEEHCVQAGHALHPAQLVLLYPTQPSKKAGVPLPARFHGSALPPVDMSAANIQEALATLTRVFMHKHDATVSLLAAVGEIGDVADTPPTALVDAAMRIGRACGRVTHLPYLMALSAIIAGAHNGNKHGCEGLYVSCVACGACSCC